MIVESTVATTRHHETITIGAQTITLPARPLVMGIVNITPDSFSDGGVFFAPEKAVAHVRRLVDEGAELIDIGGESSRPGAEPVDIGEEWRRIGPVLSRVTGTSPVPISVDTYKAEIARRALDSGASVINDISALRFDPEMAAVVGRGGASVVLMHMQGTPRSMQQHPAYADVMGEIVAFLNERIAAAQDAGIPHEKIIVDPGIGFGKTLGHNLQILQRMAELAGTGCPVLLGASRKSFIGRISGVTGEYRLPGSLAAVVLAARAGVRIVRVHDVQATRRALEVCAAVAEPDVWADNT
jgi:dihydropteroate synthase